MSYKSKEDFYLLLDEWHKDGRLPDGSVIGRTRVNTYMLKHHRNEFVDLFGRKVKSFETWFRKYDPDRNPQENIIEAQKKLDVSINILDDDFEFEEGDNEEVPPYIWPVGNWKILVLSDIHIPFHDLKAVKAAINYGRKEQVNGVILNGDTMDLMWQSKFTKNPSKPKTREEIELTKQFLSQLRKLFPSEKILFKFGNHEARLKKQIWEKMPDLAGIDALNLESMIGLKDFNIEYISTSQIIHIGKLRVLHAHEYGGGGGGVNVARGMRLKANHNILFGHFHKTQSDFGVNIDGEVCGSWATGCLCYLKPEYLPFNQWSQGAAIVEVSEDGMFKVNNFKIINGEVL